MNLDVPTETLFQIATQLYADINQFFNRQIVKVSNRKFEDLKSKPA